MLTRSRFFENKPLSTIVDTIPVNACLVEAKGVSGYWLDYSGVEVLGSSTCIDMGSFRWVLLSEVDVTEALALIDDYQQLFGLLVFTDSREWSIQVRSSDPLQWQCSRTKASEPPCRTALCAYRCHRCRTSIRGVLQPLPPALAYLLTHVKGSNL